MKRVIFIFTFIIPIFAYAFSLSNEKCWSAAPILKPIKESKKLDKEKRLCSLDFYQNEYSICPKLSSTNPGVLIIKRLVDMPDLDFRQKYCGYVDEAKEMGKAKVVAKFKQSISCSDSSSSVAYYRISEFLHGSHVPVAVFRTMDKEKHFEITLKANEYLSAKTDLISESWKRFLQMHLTSEKYPSIFIGSTVYGALIENIKSEFKYIEISGIGPYEFRYQRFIQQSPFLLVANSEAITTLAGGKSFKELAPVVTQMKDISNMVLTDYLLNQGDRIGNIHFKYKWYKLENGEVVDSPSRTHYVNHQDIIPIEELEKKKNGEVLVKEMILKDNDCGISKANEMKKIGALDRIKHLNPKVYEQLQKLAAFVLTKEGQNYFENELRIKTEYFLGNQFVSGIKNNIIEAARILKTNCEKGTLSLDLNLEKILMNPDFKGAC